MLNDNVILLAHWNGRFGNRLHQYIYGYYFSKLNDYKFYLPSEWEGANLFKNQYHSVVEDDLVRRQLNQSQKALDHIYFRTWALKKYSKNFKRIIVDTEGENPYRKISNHIFFDNLCAYNSNIFKIMELKEIKKVFEFNDKIKNLDIYKRWEDRQGSYDIAHLRRDDISNPQYNLNNHQGYSVVSLESYYKAFKKFEFDKDKIEWVSDDYINKWHKNRTPNKKGFWKYPVGSEYFNDIGFDWLEDFLKLYFARSIFRANSSFSWWAACLSPVAKIYSPIIDKRIIYGKDALKEIDVEFVEGNNPHWMYDCKDIVLK